jgi:tyrosyl-tRNA synthetase
VHSEADYNTAVEASNILFGNSTADSLKALSEETFLDVFDGVPQSYVTKADVESGINIIDLLADKTGVFPSRGEARKMIAGGGVSLNKQKAEDPEVIINAEDLINNKYILAQRGKKNYYLIIVQ